MSTQKILVKKLIDSDRPLKVFMEALKLGNTKQLLNFLTFVYACVVVVNNQVSYFLKIVKYSIFTEIKTLKT